MIGHEKQAVVSTESKEQSTVNNVSHPCTRLNSACFAIRMVKSLMSQDALRMIYFS
jgi:hypothetical protein